jgi:hypothetical protein
MRFVPGSGEGEGEAYEGICGENMKKRCYCIVMILMRRREKGI